MKITERQKFGRRLNKKGVSGEKRKRERDRCKLLSVMIAFLPYLGYAKYKNSKVQGLEKKTNLRQTKRKKKKRKR